MPYDVFISYARRDGTPLARQLAEALRHASLEVFWDQDSIPAGANWEKTLDDALEESTHIVVILTPYSVISEEVAAEWRPMLSKGKNILPVMYLPCEVPRRLSMRQYIDFQDPSQFSIRTAELVTAINAFSGTAVEIKLSGAELMARAEAYYQNKQYDLAAHDNLAMLVDSDVMIRRRGAAWIGGLYMARLLPSMFRCLHEETDYDVRRNLLDSMRRTVKHDDWRAFVPDLFERMKPLTLPPNDKNLRIEALRVLAYAESEEAVAHVVDLLANDASGSVRRQAALTLSRLKTPPSTQALLQAVKDKKPKVRWAAVRAIGMHGDPQYIPALREISRKELDHEVRTAALDAIRDIQNGGSQLT